MDYKTKIISYIEKADEKVLKLIYEIIIRL